MKDMRATFIVLGVICVVAMLLNPAMIAWFIIKGLEIAVILTVVNFIARVITGKRFVDIWKEMLDEQK